MAKRGELVHPAQPDQNVLHHAAWGNIELLYRSMLPQPKNILIPIRALDSPQCG
jgi:hypothetical protein